MTTTYIIKDTLAAANAYNQDITQRCLEQLERVFTVAGIVYPHPDGEYNGDGEYTPWEYISGDARCLIGFDDADFDPVATTEELALKKTRGQVEALGWFPPEE